KRATGKVAKSPFSGNASKPPASEPNRFFACFGEREGHDKGLTAKNRLGTLFFSGKGPNMLPRIRFVLATLLGVALTAGSLPAADATSSLQKGTPELQSAGPLAFGPDGVLFVGDPRGA